ncbi:ATP-binding cassette domain-containing protein [Nannocystaceae bacterium ST9]
MGSELVEVREVGLRRGGVAILEQVEFTLGPGLFALVGANGSGKSTLLRALAGLAMPARGSIAIAGHDLWTDPVAARRALGYMPESPEFFPFLAPHELIATIASVRGVSPEPARERFVAWVGASALDLRIGMLSAGQRRKLALALALLGEPRVLLLDEPVNTLDAAAVEDLRALLRARRAAGSCVIVAIHQEASLALEFEGRLAVAEGRVSCQLAPREPASPT